MQKQNGKYYKSEFHNLLKTANHTTFNAIDKKCFLQRVVNMGNQLAHNYNKRKKFYQKKIYKIIQK